MSCFSDNSDRINYDEDIFSSQLWNETSAKDKGIIKENTRFANDRIELICSGPHIGVATPVFQTPRSICNSKGAYDRIDLQTISERYLPRSKYAISCNINEYIEKIPVDKFNNKYTDCYRLVSRSMLNLKQERTLISAIIPSKVGHINGIIGLEFYDLINLAIASGLYVSLPYDFFTKVLGKTNLFYSTASKLPIFKLDNEIPDDADNNRFDQTAQPDN